MTFVRGCFGSSVPSVKPVTDTTVLWNYLFNCFLCCTAGSLRAFDGFVANCLCSVDCLFADLLSGAHGFVLGVFGLITGFAYDVLTLVRHEARGFCDGLTGRFKHVLSGVYDALFAAWGRRSHGAL